MAIILKYPYDSGPEPILEGTVPEQSTQPLPKKRGRPKNPNCQAPSKRIVAYILRPDYHYSWENDKLTKDEYHFLPPNNSEASEPQPIVCICFFAFPKLLLII